MGLIGRFFLWLSHPGEYRLVKVKSLRFSFGPYGLEGPSMLVDGPYGQRQTIAPVWDGYWLKARFWRQER